MSSKALIIGGSNGLGLELAKLFKHEYSQVIVTGRTEPSLPGLTFVELALGSGKGFPQLMDWLIAKHSPFDLVVYNPGFYQEGKISELTDKQIIDMNIVGFAAAALLMQRIMKKQDLLSCFVAITSTSQWTPREYEPIYTAVKAALGMFANSLALDPRIKKTLVVAPSGMQTKFWQHTDKDTSEMLDPAWVAAEIMELLASDFSYKHAAILRKPPRVEIIDIR